MFRSLTGKFGSVALAAALIGAAGIVPAAHATEEEVVATMDKYYYSNGAGVFVVATCRGDATPTAAWTSVHCTVDDTYLRAEMPPEPGTEVWNFSFTQLSGPFAAAVWIGSDDPPVRICARAQASFNSSQGPPILKSDEECETIYV